MDNATALTPGNISKEIADFNKDVIFESDLLHDENKISHIPAPAKTFIEALQELPVIKKPTPLIHHEHSYRIW